MGDTRRVDFDTSGARMMRALADTAGMDGPERAAFWLEHIAAKLHRGPRKDTWTSARDRAASYAGVERTIAKRIWQRWRDMQTVSFDVGMRLAVAYENLCVANETAADNYKAERLRGRDAETEQGPDSQGMGMDPAANQQVASTSLTGACEGHSAH